MVQIEVEIKNLEIVDTSLPRRAYANITAVVIARKNGTFKVKDAYMSYFDNSGEEMFREDIVRNTFKFIALESQIIELAEIEIRQIQINIEKAKVIKQTADKVYISEVIK